MCYRARTFRPARQLSENGAKEVSASVSDEREKRRVNHEGSIRIIGKRLCPRHNDDEYERISAQFWIGKANAVGVSWQYNTNTPEMFLMDGRGEAGMLTK